MAAPTGVRDVIGRRRATMLEALGGGGLLLVRDSAEAEGRSVLRALVSEAVSRAEQVLVLLLEVPREQFQEGLSPEVTQRLHFRDLSADPLGWLGRPRPSPTRPPGGLLGELLGLGEGQPQPLPHPQPNPSPTPSSGGLQEGEGLRRGRGNRSPSPTPSSGGLRGGEGQPQPLPHPPQPRPSPRLLVLDSLSWLLLREPLPQLGPALQGALLAGGRGEGKEPPPRVVALLHQELHPESVLGALGALARAQLILGGPPQSPGAPRSLRLLRDPHRAGGDPQETLTLLPDGSWGAPPPPDPSPNFGGGGAEPPKPPNLPQNSGLPPLTFRLGLSGPERGARAALTPPYLPRSRPEPPPEDPEDPDEDLDL